MQWPRMSTWGETTGAHHPQRHLRRRHAKLGVDAGDDHVEPFEQVVVEVERAVLVDVDLHAGEDAERVELGVELLDHLELGQQAVTVEPVGDGQAGRVVGEHHVLVAHGDRRRRHRLDGGPTVAPRRVAGGSRPATHRGTPGPPA